jgi:hypothetical protein
MIAGGRFVIPWRMGQRWNLYPLFDIHLGSPGCAEDAFARHVERIKADPHGLWLLGGDAIDAIGYRDKRFDPRATPSWLKVSDLARLGGVLFDYLLTFLAPIKSKCVGLAWGNHEDSMLRDSQAWDRWSAFCATIGAPDLGICGLRDLVFRDRSGRAESKIRVLVHHGAGAATTAGGKINRLRKALDDFPGADLVLIGHLHDRVEHYRTGIDADESCQGITDSTRLGVMCGTFLRTYTAGSTSYGEIRGYSATPLGNPVIEIDPAARSLSVGWPK